jgi:hypothetical protein
VVNEKAAANGGTGVYFYLGEKAVDLRNQARREIAFVPVEEVGHAVPP